MTHRLMKYTAFWESHHSSRSFAVLDQARHYSLTTHMAL